MCVMNIAIVIIVNKSFDSQSRNNSSLEVAQRHQRPHASSMVTGRLGARTNKIRSSGRASLEFPNRFEWRG